VQHWEYITESCNAEKDSPHFWEMVLIKVWYHHDAQRYEAHAIY
jgi:hypothetical protein